MSDKLPVIRRIKALRKQIAIWRRQGDTIALLPTMGALHEGHLALARRARKKCDRTVVSIFVNPAQFAPNEDFKSYPRDQTSDLAKLKDIGCDLVWAPSGAEMYGEIFATKIVPEGAALGLETDDRPQFFTGVATVCTKLFCQVQPDIAVFGEKDYQQLQLMHQLVRDLDLPMKILGVATIREKDGLAMSSRNAYLSDEERAIAPLLHEQIKIVAAKVADGGRRAPAINNASKTLTKAGFKVDYIEIRDAVTLARVKPRHDGLLRVLAAARLGKTRLIDNCAVK